MNNSSSPRLSACVFLSMLIATPALAKVVDSRSSLKLDSSLFTQQPVDDPSANESAETPPAFGEPGAWWWSLGMAGSPIGDGEGDVYANFQLHRFLVQDFEMGLEVVGSYFNQTLNDAYGGGFVLNFRWHFINKDRYSVFAETGAGFQITSHEVPDTGSEFNFTPRAGMGMTWKIFPDRPTRLMFGARWQHVSNGRTQGGADRNPGKDNGVIYLSVMFPF